MAHIPSAIRRWINTRLAEFGITTTIAPTASPTFTGTITAVALQIVYSSASFFLAKIFRDANSNFVIGQSELTPQVGVFGATLAGAGAGNVDNGVHSYKVTFVTADGETSLSPGSVPVTVVDKTANGKVSLAAIPVSTSGFVTARKLYRTVAGGSTFKLLTTINDNTTTTYTDNTADASLGATGPTTNSTMNSYIVLPLLGGGIQLPNLPTADPHVVGQLYNSSGAVKVSAG